VALPLLKPHLLTIKNRFLQESRRSLFNRELAVVVLSALAAVGIFVGTNTFIGKIRDHPQFDPLILARLMSICLFAFFLLLLFSNCIAALGYLFSAKDLPLLLRAPVKPFALYTSRLIQVVLTSSWMFLLFSIPALFGLHQAMDLSWSFVPVSLGLLFPFVIIPASLGMIFVLIFVNLISPHRMRDLLVIAALLIAGLLLYLNHGSSPQLSSDQEKLNELIHFLYSTDDPQPVWSPARWLSEILASYFGVVSNSTGRLIALLVGTSIACFTVGFILFRCLFFRGWSRASNSRRTMRIHHSGIGASIGRFFLPNASQFRALCAKEVKTFFRDTLQSLQLLMLLMLTFIYLYNFRALRVASKFSDEGLAWWQVVLSIANIAFGACVVSAIATRFVFPSISLEGRAYAIMRSTPLTIAQLLRYKVYTWFIPISILSLILLVSGTMAIQATFGTVLASAVVAIAISIGITGLAVGVGAVFARFDWDSPSQVTASFGSLVYMLLALGCIVLTIIPTGFLFILTSVPGFVQQMNTRDYYLGMACCVFLCYAINLAAARRALSAGRQHLEDLEA